MTVKNVAVGSDTYYGYDLQGQQLYARFGSASGAGIANVYDGFGRLASTTTDQSGTALTISHRYDADGNRVRTTWPDNQYVTYVYDGLDRMTSVKQGTGLIASMTYAASGLLASETRGGVTTTYDYDEVLRLESLADDLAGAGADVTTGLDYNPANQIVTRTRSNDAYAYTGYVNVSRGYARNGLNQYTSAGSATFCYDAAGNLTSDGTTVYEYDYANRLKRSRAAVSGACPVAVTGAIAASLHYDPLGRLYQTSGSGAGTTRYLYDGDELVAEYNASGTMLRRYVHGMGDDDPLIWYEGAGLTDQRSLQTDHQGSIVSIANASGTSLGINSYDEYGIPAAGNQGTFQYTGQAWITPLGMYYYKARIYSPTLGRFMQTDPIGYDDQINLYAYVANDPVNGTDPTGMEECHSNGDGTQTCTSNGSILDNAALALRAGYELLAYYTGLPSLTPNASPATPPKQEDSGDRAGRGGDGRPLSRGDNGGPSDPKIPVLPPPTEHGQQRRDQAAAGDTHRQVGDPNRVIREGRTFRDTQTGNTIHVNGNRVVVTNAQGQEVTR